MIARHLAGYRLLVLGLLLVCGSFASVARADGHYKLQELVEKARFTLEMFNADEGMQQFREYVQYAHAMLIVPDYMRGAFGLGFGGGKAVMLRRDPQTGEWSYPAFYSLRSASIGLQLGGSNAEVVMIVMTEEGIDDFGQTQVKLGADAAVAAGSTGYGVAGGTPMTFSADYASFARAKGAFMGASLSGSSVVVKPDWNQRYYGRAVEPMEILGGAVANPAADGLRRAAREFFDSNR